MTASSTLAGPRLVVVLIAGITVIPLGALVWLGWTILGQDRLLEKQQAEQQLAHAADLVVGALQRSLADSERRLAAGERDWAEGSVALTFAIGDRSVDAVPRERVTYLPAVAVLPEPPPEAFTLAERLDYRERKLDAAISSYRELTRSPNPAVRVGAQLRLAHAFAGAGRIDEALAAYAVAAGVDGFAVGQQPVGLVARYARCQLLEANHRNADLAAESSALGRDLSSGRWALTETLYTLYAGDVERWSRTRLSQSSPDDTLLREGVRRLWGDWQSGERAWPARWTIDVGASHLTVLSPPSRSPRRVLLASSAFARSEWIDASAEVARAERVSVAFRDLSGRSLFDTSPLTAAGPTGRPAWPSVERRAIQADLPWSLVVTAEGAADAAAGFARSRQLLVTGFALIVILSAGASYVTARAVNRELAVARLQADFVAAVSHEFRTPLTTMRQFTERLHEYPRLTEDDRRECYEMQLRATGRLTRLVESLLDFGRMQAGVRQYDRRTLAAADLVGRVVEEFRAQPQAAGCEITFGRSCDVVLDADAQALSLAIWNLLDNAVKYSPDDRRVEVELAVQDGRACIAVRDHGLGISQSELRSVFVQFRRGIAARERGIAGTGIGLALVDRIVRAHGGRVDVLSRPGGGSTFTIVLPLAASSEI